MVTSFAKDLNKILVALGSLSLSLCPALIPKQGIMVMILRSLIMVMKASKGDD